MEFNHVFKFSLFSFFTYDMLTVSSLLVTIQFELVEYIFAKMHVSNRMYSPKIDKSKTFLFCSCLKWADDPNSLEIVLLILVLNWNVSFIFLLCEPGEKMINQLGEFSDELNRCDWYLLAVELQRQYTIFLSDTQNPIKIWSYANITCERETSKRVLFFSNAQSHP